MARLSSSGSRHADDHVTTHGDAGIDLLRRINGERLVILGWSRAILLQLAHPLVAAGVYDHSDFRSSPLAAVKRLRSTVRAMLAIAFGDVARQARAIGGIQAIHRRVNGVIPDAVGVFPAGTPYSAEDPALVLWVHTTLTESTLIVYDRFIEPLAIDARDRYCDAAATLPVALGARSEDVPRSWTALTAFNDRAIQSGEIEVGRQARELAAVLVGGPVPRMVPPAGWLNRLVTAGLLPPRIRRGYAFEWTPGRERSLERVADVIRTVRRVTPAFAARFADARVADRAARVPTRAKVPPDRP